jgi:hypothetical protein
VRLRIKSLITEMLFGTIPAYFTSAYTLDESVERLAMSTTPSPVKLLFSECAVGIVTAEHVSLHLTAPFFGNSFKPYFTGAFEDINERIVLFGFFSMHWSVKSTILVWFGIGIPWTVIATIANDHNAWAGIVMLIFGCALIAVGRWFARNDIAQLSDIIEKALGKEGDPCVKY